MPWVVGIDEAGYGPNLGPLVQAAVGLYLPDDDHAGWKTLKPVVRRCRHKADERLLIDDSKKVYTRHGIAGLERGVYSGLGLTFASVGEFAAGLILQHLRDDLASETWFDGAESLPLESVERSESLPGAISAAVSLVQTPRFNRVCDEYDSKGAVLTRGAIELLTATYARLEPDGTPVAFLCDKQGGRNFYAAMIQTAFPTGWVVAEVESTAESRYRVDYLDRPVNVVFRPRADAESVAVALASMVCKYLREVCMRQFNRFWAKHVPGIQPTAGYPGDAKRFFDEIKPAMAKLGLTDDQVWRKR